MKPILVVPSEAEAVSAPRTRSIPWALAALSLSMLLPSLGTSIANVGLPTLAAAFDSPFQDVQWVVLAYLLTVTALVVGAGRLGDIFGRRRLLLIGIAVFTAASLLSGAAPSLGLLIAARAAQGVGAAIMMALTVAFVADTVPPGKTGGAMGLLGTMSAIGTAFGPSLGGVLIAAFGWHALFLVTVPMGVLALAVAYRHLPDDRQERNAPRPRFDSLGTVLLVLTLASYALAMTLGRGTFGPLNAALLVAAILGIGLFLRVEASATSPLIRPSMFRDRDLSARLVMSLLVATVMMATLVVGPFYLALGLGFGETLVGLALSAGPVVAALTGMPAGRIVDRYGARRVVIIGLAAVAAGAFAVALMPRAFGLAGYIGPIVVVTAGYALFQAANTTAVMTDIAADRRGVFSGLLNLSRNLGLITGAAGMGAVFALASGPLTAAHPDAVAAGMRITFAVATTLALLALALSIRPRADSASASISSAA